jgi:hypothetical protein
LTDEIKTDLQQVLKDFKDMWKEKRSAAVSGASSTSTVSAAPATT